MSLTLLWFVTQAWATELKSQLKTTCPPYNQPCLKSILDSDSEIVPPDWLNAVDRELGGRLAYLVIHLTILEGAVDLSVRGVPLDLRAARDLGRGSYDWYIPVTTTDLSRGIEVGVVNNGPDEQTVFELSYDGA
ncbi:MAG: hypothetical protein ABMB14_33480 [Myxococcota bacterium]